MAALKLLWWLSSQSNGIRTRHNSDNHVFCKSNTSHLRKIYHVAWKFCGFLFLRILRIDLDPQKLLSSRRIKNPQNKTPQKLTPFNQNKNNAFSRLLPLARYTLDSNKKIKTWFSIGKSNPSLDTYGSTTWPTTRKMTNAQTRIVQQTNHVLLAILRRPTQKLFQFLKLQLNKRVFLLSTESVSLRYRRTYFCISVARSRLGLNVIYYIFHSKAPLCA